MRFVILLVSTLVLAGCQHGGYWLPDKDHDLLEQCLTTVSGHQQALARQQEQLQQHQELLDDIRGQVSRGPVVEAQLDALSAQLDAISERLQQDCSAEQAQVIAPPPSRDSGMLVGRVEQVFFQGPEVLMPARIDTGAKTSSLDARNIQDFERDGEEWVRFELHLREGESHITLERPRSRGVRIVSASAEDAERRHVVEMRVSLGDVTQKAEFTLADRTGMEYPVLIGRNVLQDLMIVDVSKRNAAPPLKETADMSEDQQADAHEDDTEASASDEAADEASR